jgi:hypothetical protein
MTDVAGSAETRRSPFSLGFSLRQLWDTFTLRSVEQQVAHRTVGQSRQGRAFFERAAVQNEAARAMLESGDVSAALEIAKASAMLYARAQLTADGIPDAASSPAPDVWTTFVARRRAVGDARAWMTRIPELRFDDELESEAVAEVGRVLDLLDWLEKTSEVRSLVDVRHQRIRRLAALGSSLVLGFGWLAYGWIVPPNVALNRPVTASSRHPQSIAVDGGLVDGVITDMPYGVHTNVEEHPWVAVDLEKVRNLKRIKLYNRGEFLFDEVLPLSLEISLDGKTFTEVDRRTTSFGQTSPWVASLGGTPGRYIRVTGKPQGWVALSELEAYER